MRIRAWALWACLMGVGILAASVAVAVVSTTTPRNDYTGNGSTATYSYTFRIFDATDLLVVKTTTAGVATSLVYPTDYTVTGVNKNAGGTITLTAGNLASGESLVIKFNRTPRQSTDLRNQGSFFPETHESKFDELTRYIQSLHEIAARSIRQPDNEVGSTAKTILPASRANKFLAFDSSSNLIAAAGTSANLGPVSSFVNTVLDDADGNTVLSTIGTAPSDPRVVINTTAPANRRGFIDFRKSGASKYIIALDQFNLDEQVLRFYDAQNDRYPLMLLANGDAQFYGAVDLTQGGASKGQVKFPSTQVSSSDVNTLDDYEEGTCTLSLGGTATYTTRTCHYTKIGRQVTVHFNLVVNTIGTGSASIITYSAGPPAVATEAHGIGACLWSSAAVSPVNLNVYATPGTSTFIMRGNTAAATGDTTLNIFGNGASTTCTVTYFAAS